MECTGVVVQEERAYRKRRFPVWREVGRKSVSSLISGLNGNLVTKFAFRCELDASQASPPPLTISAWYWQQLCFSSIPYGMQLPAPVNPVENGHIKGYKAVQVATNSTKWRNISSPMAGMEDNAMNTRMSESHLLESWPPRHGGWITLPTAVGWKSFHSFTGR